MDKKDFKPHMMYDPKTGKGYMAKKYADHVKMDKMGYTHDKPEMKEFHAKGMEPSSRKKAKPSSTRKSLGDIRKRADSMSIVRSKRSTASMRNKAGLGTREGMENMCCKNCGDMFGKPTKENKSCQYNAYDPKGENWTEAKKIRITPKMQRRALASKSAQAKPKSQVTLKKAPWDKKKEQTEAFDFKVNIDGFPEMFMSGNSPGEVKTHLRKLIKQPSMIQSVDRVTKHDKKKHHRDKVNEGMKYTHAAIDKSGKVIGMASQESDAKDMARRNNGRVVKLKKPMSDKKGDMMINRQFKESLQSIDEAVNVMKELNLDEGKMKQLHQYMDQGKSAAWIAAKMKLDLKTVKALIGEQNRYQSIKTSIGNFLSRVKNKVMGNRPTGTASRANLRAKGVPL